jgi:hypothetical protein
MVFVMLWFIEKVSSPSKSSVTSKLMRARANHIEKTALHPSTTNAIYLSIWAKLPKPRSKSSSMRAISLQSIWTIEPGALRS